MPICPSCQADLPPKTSVCPHDQTEIPPGLEGKVLGERYRIIRELGKGGMGWVYLAEHVILGKQVAVKVLRGEYSRQPELVKRFQLEAVAASQIGQENIVDVTDFGQTPDEWFYFVMEYVPGKSLAQLIDGNGPIPYGRTLALLIQISKALGAAHSRGIVHRDLKPDNVLVTRKADGSEHAKVLDFGISKVGDGPGSAKITQVGMVVGTPHYMAPEQATAQAIDLRVDIYALGVLGYEMLVGRVPFDAENSLHILMAHQSAVVPPMRERAPNIEIPPRLEALIMQCLEKNRGDRPQSMGEVGRTLAACMVEVGITSGPTPLMMAAIPLEARASQPSIAARPPSGSDDPARRVPTEVAGIQSGPGRVPSALEPSNPELVQLPPPPRSKQIVIGDSAPGKANVSTDPVLDLIPPRRSGKLWLGVGAALLVIAGLVALALRPAPAPATIAIVTVPPPAEPEPVPAKIEPVVAAPPTPAPVAPVAIAAPAPVIPAKLELRRVTVRSVPPGAQVFASEGKLLGPTPLELDVAPGQSRKVKLAARGYHEAWKTLEGSDREVSVRLEKLAAQAEAKPAAPAPKPASDGKLDDLKPYTP